jgi:hypothetical protein
VRYWVGLFALRARHDPTVATTLFEEALAAKPEEPRYLLALAKALGVGDAAPRDPERLAKVMEALARRAQSSMQLELLARYHYHAQHSRLDVALSFAERSVKADPTCAACLDTYARVSFAKGDLAEAVYAEERAVAALPERSVDEAMVARLVEYAKAYEAKEKEKRTPAESKP